MAQVSPWHAINSDVYHDCTNCNTGNNIETENKKSGTGGKSRCNECKELSNKGKC